MAVLTGVLPVDVHLKRSGRSRRFSLRVSRLDGKVTLSIPLRARETEALEFLRGQEAWLRETLAAMPDSASVPVRLGALLPVEGRSLMLAPGSGRVIREAEGSLLVPGAPEQAAARVGAWLKVLARDRLAEASARHAGTLQRRYTRLTLRDTRSRWGSCSPDGALMYSWRLIMAPPSVLDYVAAHEAAHLVQMNHSAAFWDVVLTLCPNWKRERQWLHDHGQTLHRFRFGD
ncbi:MAG: SprT family zinc-dependent metalloprotease [Tabrizicola sp.]|uniref:M48 family metallopeptidase n=1 Tax=Tabrizicola sp. TaxID=2005166 RepID=UPI0027331C6E|nr:SprT family zinc-dependent metalloprotease [Tabrizicola sp.]MDP3261869.1 SprT family zinc-dependent metalloprotease [Tabrizicola sp.]MDP3650033.1 SprT family zinc-dependent metalloprotease [Paracoccaceae bacterium]MDZ4065332.1 SprT family zinc-dependent metalloprotease [Tabrizicola sp.]